MTSLAAGNYYLVVAPFGDGGTYEVEVICETGTPSPTFACENDTVVTAELAGFSGDVSILNGVYEYDDSFYGYTRSVGNTMVLEIKKDPGFWAIYVDIGGTGTAEDEYTAYCELADITECAGWWKVYNSFLEAWVTDDDVTFLHSDCDPPDDCDLTSLSDRDMDCPLKSLYLLSLYKVSFSFHLG